jgi:hypothetical protein
LDIGEERKAETQRDCQSFRAWVIHERRLPIGETFMRARQRSSINGGVKAGRSTFPQRKDEPGTVMMGPETGKFCAWPWPSPWSTRTRSHRPDASQDHGDLAGYGDTRLLRSDTPREPRSPCFEGRPTLHFREKDTGSLIKLRAARPRSHAPSPDNSGLQTASLIERAEPVAATLAPGQTPACRRDRKAIALATCFSLLDGTEAVNAQLQSLRLISLDVSDGSIRAVLLVIP